MIRMLSLFSGIGAAEKALKNVVGEESVEIVDAVEFDKFAINSYNAIHHTNFPTQDVSKWHKDVKDVDILVGGSPCQDFSVAGLHQGGDEGSGTRSSLMYEQVRIITEVRPKVAIWENVKNVLGKSNRHNFDKYLVYLDEIGYNNYYKVLNASDYGIPQSRERIFIVSIRKDVDKGTFEFPSPTPLEKFLGDYMVNDEKDIPEEYWLSPEKISRIANWNCYEKPFKRVYGKKSICGTITTRSGAECGGMKVYCNDLENTHDIHQMILMMGKLLPFANLRKFMPIEMFRLMGFSDEDYYNAERVNSKAQLYKQAGNSICVPVLEAIFKELIGSVR